jgi:hypothetical protein
LGLFGLSAHSTEQRIKEIGIRKAMGAAPATSCSLLMWQFTKPVLWANLIALKLSIETYSHRRANSGRAPAVCCAASAAANSGFHSMMWRVISSPIWSILPLRP